MNKNSIAGIKVKNYMVAASCPLTESVNRVVLCEKAGFGAAILKSCADYERSGKGYNRKVVYADGGSYADSSFEREIAVLEEGLRLYEESKKRCKQLLIIPSVTVFSLEPAPWKKVCREFAVRGAKLIQLDFFYLGSLLHDENFYNKLQILMEELTKEEYIVMPKVNVNFDAERVMALFSQTGVRVVSLLDSIRKAAPEKYDMHPETTSFFGSFQLPYTIEYVKTAKKYGLEVCGGGGVQSKEDVEELLKLGADTVQIASYVLRHGYASLKELAEVEQVLDEKDRKHHTWCDVEDGMLCQNCGACKFV